MPYILRDLHREGAASFVHIGANLSKVPFICVVGITFIVIAVSIAK